MVDDDRTNVCAKPNCELCAKLRQAAKEERKDVFEPLERFLFVACAVFAFELDHLVCQRFLLLCQFNVFLSVWEWVSR